MESKYKWNYGRLTAFLVAGGNLVFLSIIVLNALINPSFVNMQLGIDYHMNTLMKVFIIVLYFVIAVTINIRFIRRINRSRVFLALLQTITMAFIIRNLFVGFLFSGAHIGTYIGNLSAFAFNGILIYHTLFSQQINKYFHHI